MNEEISDIDIVVPNRTHENWRYYPLAKKIARTSWKKSNLDVDRTDCSDDEIIIMGGKLLGSSKNLAFGEDMVINDDFARLEKLANLDILSNKQRELETDQVLLTTKPGQSLKIYLIHKSIPEETASFTSIILKIADNSHLKIIERFEQGPQKLTEPSQKNFLRKPSLSSLRMVADVGRNATYTRIRFQNADDSYLTFYREHVTVKKNGCFGHHLVDLGSKAARSEITVSLDEQGANSKCTHLALPQTHQYHESRASVDHVCGNTKSNLLSRLIANNNGEATCNARTHILKDASNSSTIQSIGCLLLTHGARVNPKPELEIHTDEVEAAHGCTVGNLDAEALFYLQSRGISKFDSQAILTHSFATPAISTLPEEMVEQINNRLKAPSFYNEVI